MLWGTISCIKKNENSWICFLSIDLWALNSGILLLPLFELSKRCEFGRSYPFRRRTLDFLGVDFFLTKYWLHLKSCESCLICLSKYSFPDCFVSFLPIPLSRGNIKSSPASYDCIKEELHVCIIIINFFLLW